MNGGVEISPPDKIPEKKENTRKEGREKTLCKKVRASHPTHKTHHTKNHPIFDFAKITHFFIFMFARILLATTHSSQRVCCFPRTGKNKSKRHTGTKQPQKITKNNIRTTCEHLRRAPPPPRCHSHVPRSKNRSPTSVQQKKNGQKIERELNLQRR